MLPVTVSCSRAPRGEGARLARALKILLCAAVLVGIVTATAEGGQAPLFKGRDLNRKTVVMKDLLEEGPVLIVFWATCCSNTITLMHHMEALHKAYNERGFKVLGIAENDTKTVGQVKPWVAAQRLTLPVLLDPEGQILRLYHVQATPHMVLVDQTGAIVFSHAGFMPGEEGLCETAIRSALGLENEDAPPQ